jgi:hypothetical protein
MRSDSRGYLRNTSRGNVRNESRGAGRADSRGPSRNDSPSPARNEILAHIRNNSQSPARNNSVGLTRNNSIGPGRNESRGPVRDASQGPARDSSQGPARERKRSLSRPRQALRYEKYSQMQEQSSRRVEDEGSAKPANPPEVYPDLDEIPVQRPPPASAAAPRSGSRPPPILTNLPSSSYRDPKARGQSRTREASFSAQPLNRSPQIYPDLGEIPVQRPPPASAATPRSGSRPPPIVTNLPSSSYRESKQRGQSRTRESSFAAQPLNRDALETGMSGKASAGKASVASGNSAQVGLPSNPQAMRLGFTSSHEDTEELADRDDSKAAKPGIGSTIDSAAASLSERDAFAGNEKHSGGANFGPSSSTTSSTQGADILDLYGKSEPNSAAGPKSPLADGNSGRSIQNNFATHPAFQPSVSRSGKGTTRNSSSIPGTPHPLGTNSRAEGRSSFAQTLAGPPELQHLRQTLPASTFGADSARSSRAANDDSNGSISRPGSTDQQLAAHRFSAHSKNRSSGQAIKDDDSGSQRGGISSRIMSPFEKIRSASRNRSNNKSPPVPELVMNISGPIPGNTFVGSASPPLRNGTGSSMLLPAMEKTMAPGERHPMEVRARYESAQHQDMI